MTATDADTGIGEGVWAGVLAECEARLDTAEAALEHGRPVAVPAFAVPEVEGAIPEAFIERARRCAARGDAIQARLAGESERLRVELRRLPRMPRVQGRNRFDAQA